MSEIKSYKCPCCDGAIEFDSNSQKMKCPYCGTSFEVETLKGYDENLKEDSEDNISWENTAGKEWTESEKAGLRSYICNTCGGEIIGDETTAASECPYCGNPVVMVNQLSGVLKPDYVIPFKLDKKAAKEILKKHYEGKILLPKIFKSENKIEEIKGIYVPFWLFDADTDAHIRYKATKVSMWSDSKYNYTKTSYYSLIRGGSIGFRNIPVDGSKKMQDELMESIEPYNYSEAVDFQTAYLSGYFADKYDVDAETSVKSANERVKNSTADAFRETIGAYSTVTAEAVNINVHNGKTSYALLPVWILNTDWNGNKYRFAINGQTGKIAGELPMDKGAFWRWFIGIAGIAGAVTLGITFLFHLM